MELIYYFSIADARLSSTNPTVCINTVIRHFQKVLLAFVIHNTI